VCIYSCSTKVWFVGSVVGSAHSRATCLLLEKNCGDQDRWGQMSNASAVFGELICERDLKACCVFGGGGSERLRQVVE
jgi:hypothetical protein